jgi:hypothetical protein
MHQKVKNTYIGFFQWNSTVDDATLKNEEIETMVWRKVNSWKMLKAYQLNFANSRKCAIRLILPIKKSDTFICGDNLQMVLSMLPKNRKMYRSNEI